MFEGAVKPSNSSFNIRSRLLRLCDFSSTEQQLLEGWESIIILVTALSIGYVRETWSR